MIFWTRGQQWFKAEVELYLFTSATTDLLDLGLMDFQSMMYDVEYKSSSSAI